MRKLMTTVLGVVAFAALPGAAQARTSVDPCAGVRIGFIQDSGIWCGPTYRMGDETRWLPQGFHPEEDLRCPPNYYIKGTDYWSGAFSYKWGWDYWVDGGDWVLWDGGISPHPYDAVLEHGLEAYNGLEVSLENWSGQTGTWKWIDVRPFLICVRNPFARAAPGGQVVSADAGAPEELPGAGDGGHNTLEGNENDNALVGLAGDDRLHGGAGEDHLHGGSGEDALFGGVHDDLIHGRRHADKAVGGNGNDDILTGKSSDIARGGADGDQLFDNEGRDILRGGKGNDRFSASDGDRDVIRCGPGEDIAIIDSEDVAIDCEHAYRSAAEMPARLPEI